MVAKFKWRTRFFTTLDNVAMQFYHQEECRWIKGKIKINLALFCQLLDHKITAPTSEGRLIIFSKYIFTGQE